MKTTTAFLALCALAIAGCDRSETQAPQGMKLTLQQPADQTLKRGETNDIAISIDRSNFEGPVQIAFDDLPKGVSIVEKKEIPANESRLNFTIHAAPDAEIVTDHLVKVTAKGPENLAATSAFRLSIEAPSAP